MESAITQNISWYEHVAKAIFELGFVITLCIIMIAWAIRLVQKMFYN
jgi:hypothetical protein